MHICAKGVAVHCSFCVIFGIVSMTFEHFSQRFCSTKIRTTTMIFKANQGITVPIDRYISRASRLLSSLMNSPCIEYSKSPHIRPISWSIVMCQQLVTTTHCQDRNVIFNSSPQADALDLK